MGRFTGAMSYNDELAVTGCWCKDRTIEREVFKQERRIPTLHKVSKRKLRTTFRNTCWTGYIGEYDVLYSGTMLSGKVTVRNMSELNAAIAEAGFGPKVTLWEMRV